MNINKVRIVMATALALGVAVTARAEEDPQIAALMKAMDAEIAQANTPEVKAEVAKAAATSTVGLIQEAAKAEDAGSEAIVAVQNQPMVAEAKADVPATFDVVEKVIARTAEALKVGKNEIGNFNHKTGRIVVVGEATMPMDVKGDKKGGWAIKRTMLAKSAQLNAKLKLATALGFELTAEEQQRMFNMPATSNSAEKAVVKTSSAVKFASDYGGNGASAGGKPD